MLRVEGISKSLGNFALRDVSFNVGDGEYFVLLGASGVGKTVLLEIVAGLVVPDRGRVYLDGRDVTRERIQDRRLGLVYQDRALFPGLTAKRNVAYGLRCAGLRRREVAGRVRKLADDMGIQALLDRWPETLSGGEAQRVALARALATEPRCLLLDEPLSSLDTQSRGEIRAMLRGLHRSGQTIVHVTHDYEEAISLATQVGIMEAGTIVQAGSPKEVFQHPKSEFVARFVGIRNFFRGVLAYPDQTPGATAQFVTDGLTCHVLTDCSPGPGCLLVRSEDITVSTLRPDSSARNVLAGTIIDTFPARLGLEVVVDVGVEMAALITTASLDRLDLHCGKRVWASFKASAARFIEE